ncbi:hypothetical protein GCM10011571_00510 [Marinithermofilum abyssi]|uniref:DUF2935 domain-containing protein n=1 Tax=Marinithermofilum abyssi TaxID=1571185 RepID=A0A8J2Y8F8_9BACL|nr:DUF2935 domain-containing protein [Marinithermofilum abyssi]GGE03555.1 hypothetical protein GCM10011571_00510 [Marinithermofilum abyssi]
MDSSGYETCAAFEHRFWLQVLGDHGRFLADALAPKEQREWTRAVQYVQVFDQLRNEAKQAASVQSYMLLSRQAWQWTQSIRSFKLYLLHRQLTSSISIGFTPTFINHMVNEAEEYLRVLCYLMKGKCPPAEHALHHHFVWLLDAAGHAGAITDTMDTVEKELKKRGMRFNKHFEQFYLKAVEMAGYLRTCVTQFPALHRFNRQVKLELALFRRFLNELEELRLDREALGTLTPLMADHMAREECYYLTKLALSTGIQPPQCDAFS